MAPIIDLLRETLSPAEFTSRLSVAASEGRLAELGIMLQALEFQTQVPEKSSRRTLRKLHKKMHNGGPIRRALGRGALQLVAAQEENGPPNGIRTRVADLKNPLDHFAALVRSCPLFESQS